MAVVNDRLLLWWRRDSREEEEDVGEEKRGSASVRVCITELRISTSPLCASHHPDLLSPFC